MLTVGAQHDRAKAITGANIRHDAELRQLILSDTPNWDMCIKMMCLMEGLGCLSADTVALFVGRCPDIDKTSQIQAMIAGRPPVLRRS